MKAELRRVAARTVDALHEALGPALGAITPQHAAGFFRHCGYSRPGWPAKRSNCQVAEHCWDPVGLAIVEYAYRFERLRASAQGGG